MLELLQTKIAENSIEHWMLALTIAAGVMIAIGLLRYFMSRLFRGRAEQSEAPVWDVALAVTKRTKWLFILVISLFIGSLTIDISAKPQAFINSVVVITLLIQVGLWSARAMHVVIEEYRQAQIKKDPASVTTLSVMNFAARMAIWTAVLLLVLDNLGVNITALIAGLGVGGIAIALAVQTILGDLFASLAIVLDKPFVVGDFLIIGDLLGSVEYVGLKTTRLRSLSGEQLVFSNADLLSSRIRNYGRMYERRVSFNLGVTYQTEREKLKKIPQIIREAVEQQEDTRFDRSHFKEYGNFSLNYETVYYVKGPDYNKYMDIQQAINLHIHECFEQEGIEFAYPTQTLFVQQQQSPQV
jgi:small-conductance mechanosensitive channel